MENAYLPTLVITVVLFALSATFLFVGIATGETFRDAGNWITLAAITSLITTGPLAVLTYIALSGRR